MEPDGIRKYFENYLTEIRTKYESGASNVFLVRGHNILQAVGCSWYLLCGGAHASQPVDWQSFNADKTWMVVYLGISHSSPPMWLAENVEVSGKQIRFTYKKWPPPKSKDERLVVTKDLHKYFYWIPLGKLEPGDYSVQLFDADKNHEILSRLITVSQK